MASTEGAELLAPAAIEAPAPLFARLRRTQPISQVDASGVYLVATWERIEEVLAREADFSAHLTGVLIRGPEGRAVTLPLPESAASQVIATADEPAHRVHRALVQPRLAAARVTALEAPIRAWTQHALDPYLGTGGGDFVLIAEQIPARVVAALLGLPEADVQRHRTWAMLGGAMLAGDLGSQQLAAFARETREMAAYLGAHLDAAGHLPRASGPAPLLATLADGIAEGRIDRAQAVGIAIVLFGAGGESTAALIGSAVRRLAGDPELADELRQAPQLVPRFIEEVVRLETPFKFHYRSVRRPCQLGEARLGPGDRLMLLWAAANRDPAHFDEPDRLRLDRRHPKRHLGFGRGSHFCVGAPLARLEARCVVEALLLQSRHLALLPEDPPVHAPSIFVRRLARLTLAVEAA